MKAAANLNLMGRITGVMQKQHARQLAALAFMIRNHSQFTVQLIQN